jgi:protein gp37
MFRDQLRYGRDPSTVVRAADNTFYAPIRNTKWAKTREACIAEKGSHYVFTCSWSDWFHEDADEWRREAWEIVRRTPQSTYQILTKRPERIAECLPEDWGDGYPNVWLGVTIENRRFVDRADLLRGVPAAVRFLSAEPLLGPLVPDADHMVDNEHETYELGEAPVHAWRPWSDEGEHRALDLTGIDWLITGGESGPGHRRFDPQWATDLREICEQDAWEHDGREGFTAFLHKQNGGPRPDSNGRLLDGRTWDEFPTTAGEGR